MPDEVYNVQVNAEQAKRVIEDTVNVLKSYDATLEKIISTSIKMTQEGKVLTASMRYINQAGSNISTTLKNTAEGFRVIAQSTKEASTATKEFATAYNEVRAKTLKFFSGQLDMSKYFSASQSELLTYQKSIEALIQMQTQLNVSTEEVERIWGHILAGGVGSYSKELNVIRDQLIKIQGAMRNLGSSGMKEANKNAAELEKKFQRIKDNIRNQFLSSLKAANKELHQLVQSGQRLAANLEKATLARQQALAAAYAGADARNWVMNRGLNTQAMDLNQMNRYFAIISQVQNIASRHNLSISQINQAWATVVSGGLSGYDSRLKALYPILRQLIKLEIELGMAGKTAEEQAAYRNQRRMQLVKNLTSGTNEANKTVQSLIFSWQNLIRLLAIHTAYVAIFRIVSLLGDGVRNAREMNLAITEVMTIDPSKTGFTQWLESSIALSNKFGFTLKDVVEASYQALSNQVVKNTAEMQRFQDAAGKLALAGVTELSTAVNLLSSVLNSYHLNLVQADKIGAAFFKTIELGRLRADEVADSIGRVTVIANQLGIAYQEVFASLATLTIQGVKADESMTLLRNVMLKLIRPTKEMKALFRDIGVDTGEAAIEAYGYSGILELIEKRAQGSSSELGELFGRIRAVTGIMVFSGEGLKVYQKNLSQISEAMEDYEEAVRKVANTEETQIRRMVQNVTNYFTEGALEVIKGMSSLTNEFSLIGSIIKVLVNSVFYLLIGALGAITIKFAYTTVAVKLYTLGMAAATGATKAFLLANPWWLVGAAVVGAVVAVHRFVLVQNELDRKIKETYKVWVDGINEVNDADSQLRGEMLEKTALALRVMNQEIANHVAKIRSAYQVNLDGWAEYTEVITDRVLDSYKKLEDGLKRHIDAIKDKIDEYKDAIKDMQDQIIDLGFDKAQKAFELAYDDAPIEKKRKLVETYIQDLNTQLLKASDPKLVERLSRQVRQVQENYNKDVIKVREDQERDFEKLQKKRITDVNKEEKEVLKTLKQSYDLWEAMQRGATGNQTSSRRLSQALTGIDAQLKNLRPLTPQAYARQRQEALEHYKKLREDIKKEQQKPDGLKLFSDDDILQTFELAKAKIQQLIAYKQFEELKAQVALHINKLKQIAYETAFKRAKEFDLSDILESENAQYIQQKITEASIAFKIIGADQTYIDNIRKLAGRRLDELTTINLNKQREANKKILSETNKAFEELVRIYQSGFSDIVNPLKNAELALIEGGKTRNYIAEALGAVYENQGNPLGFIQLDQVEHDYKDLQAEITRITKDIQDGIFDPNKLDRPLITKYVDRLEQYMKGDRFKELEADQQKQLKLIFESLKGVIDPQKSSLEAAAEYTQLKAAAEAEFAATSKNAHLALQAQNLTMQQQLQNLQNMRQEWNNADAAIKSISQTLKSLQIPGALVPAPLNPVGPIVGVKTMAAGGFVPKGTDTVPAMLTPGEFVVNRMATQKFYSQLVAMNSMVRPQYHAGGGPVSGNFNITINADKNPQVTAKAVVAEINRGVRQGRWRLR